MSSSILIVEDAPENVQALTATLKAEGYHLSVATNGRKALDLLERVRPDLILLDVMMPEMDGFEACGRIQANPRWKDIPIIFLTSKTETEDIVRGFELGAVDYVGKPFNAHELLARVNTHLTMHHLRQSLARAHKLVRQAFGRYVSEEVAEALLQSPEALQMGGEEREVSILISDLRGFTAATMRLTPSKVIEFLNLYLETMVDVITRYHGTIVEIIGDGIFVIFGAPLANPDHARAAASCALAMQLAMPDVNTRLELHGAAGLEMGIGVHTGPVIVGNIGSERRAKYAAVGANVNLTGRIESFTTPGQVLISQATRDRAGELRIGRTYTVHPKGAQQSMEIFEVVGVDELQLPTREHVLKPVDPPVPVRFAVLEHKFVGGDAHAGQLIALCEYAADLRTDVALVPLSDLRIEVPGGNGGPPAGEVYAKVGTSPPGRVDFTAVSPDLKAWLKTVAG